MMNSRCDVSDTEEQHWTYRFLNPADLDEIKELCRSWFPVRYPEKWYLDVTSGSRFYSLAAVHPHDGHIIGLIVCDVKGISQVNREDSHLLSSRLCSCEETRVAYILSLGVVESYRRKHLGTALLKKLLDYLCSPVMEPVKAVYLHVLASNAAAIRFYEKHHFTQHVFLPYYYHISGSNKDGCSYVRYINGGKPESSILETVAESICSLCYMTRRLCARPLLLAYRLLARGFTITISRLR